MAKPGKKILVTGGAGFIGSNFLHHLYKKYSTYELFNFDLLTYAGNTDNLLDIEKVESQRPVNKRRYYFIHRDICDFISVKQAFQKHKPDVVINFAAESHVDRSIIDSRYFFRTNVIGVHNLVDLVMKHKIPRFVQISSDEIYGDVLEGTSTESSPIRPSNPYSASKAAADLLVQAHIRTHKLPAIIIRGSNNFGPYQYPEKLIPLAVTNLLENREIPIHGKGLQKRRWLHVGDFCRAIDMIMHKGRNFSIYNVAGIEMRNIDVVKEICKVLKKDYRKATYFIKDRPGGDMRYAPDDKKIKKELGWELKYPAPDYIASVVKWYLDNTSWWKKVRRKKEFKIHYRKQYKSEY